MTDSAVSVLSDLPHGAFIPEHIAKWAQVSKFQSDIPAVEIDLTDGGGLYGRCSFLTMEPEGSETLFPCGLIVDDERNGQVSVFDDRIHGYDAIECDYFAEGQRRTLECKCDKCGLNDFQPRISWLGYQVFDTGWENEMENLIPFRSSFDSIAIDLKCIKCGHNHVGYLEAETA